MEKVGLYLCIENETDWNDCWDDKTNRFCYGGGYCEHKPQSFPAWFKRNSEGHLTEWIPCDKERMIDYVQEIIEDYLQLKEKLEYL